MATTPRARSAGTQLRELVAGAALLERGGELQVLELQEHLGAERFRDSVRDSTHGVSSTWPRRRSAAC
jgi:hypothetical protein